MSLHDDIQRVLFSEEEILDGIERVASEVTEAYRGEPFTVVSVLKGSCVFAADLIRRVPVPLELAFAAISSYRQGTRPEELRTALLPATHEIEERRVLVVDDILDSGRTLRAIREEILRRGAREVRSCVFLDKPERREVDVVADHRCFEVGDVFVVGYGLDYRGRYRNLPMVAALKPEILGERPPAGTPIR